MTGEVRSVDAELAPLRAQLERLQAEVAAEREARHAAEDEARTKDEFLAVVAHELRAPLGAILGWTHLLRDGGNPQDHDNALEVIEQSVQVQAKLIDDLLTMSRMACGRLRLDIEGVDLRAIVDASVESVRPSAVGKQVSLRKKLERATGRVRGDAMRLRQVVVNLLTNAVKFTPHGGAVEVSLRPERGWAVLEVMDSGVGIAPELLPHVFDRYRQDPAAAREHGGLGLGLAIARQLVELHGGEIDAASAGDGRGATFTVRLPMEERTRAA